MESNKTSWNLAEWLEELKTDEMLRRQGLLAWTEVEGGPGVTCWG